MYPEIQFYKGKTDWRELIIIYLIITVILAIIIGITVLVSKLTADDIVSAHISSEDVFPTPEAIEIVQATPTPETRHSMKVQGTASYYSHAGCLGCHPQQIMANGEAFIEEALTLAMVPETVRSFGLLNKTVEIFNIDSGIKVMARVTDTGGFAKYNRIADLSLGTKNALGCSDLCKVVITWN